MKCKKIFSVILLSIFLCIFFTACDPPNFFHEYVTEEVVQGEIVQINLIYYDNPDVKNINTFARDEEEIRTSMRHFDFDKMTVLETLPEEKNADILQNLTEVFIVRYYNHPDSPNKTCIQLIYDDGTFEIISQTRLITLYNEDGEVEEYVGMLDVSLYFTNIVNDYFNTQIE